MGDELIHKIKNWWNKKINLKQFLESFNKSFQQLLLKIMHIQCLLLADCKTFLLAQLLIQYYLKNRPTTILELKIFHKSIFRQITVDYIQDHCVILQAFQDREHICH